VKMQTVLRVFNKLGDKFLTSTHLSTRLAHFPNLFIAMHMQRSRLTHSVQSTVNP
jgi:hypothetical protein